MEHQELQLWSNDEVKDETRLTLRHTRNPKSSPTRVFVGTVLLTLMIYAVVKMLRWVWKIFINPKSNHSLEECFSRKLAGHCCCDDSLFANSTKERSFSKVVLALEPYHHKESWSLTRCIQLEFLRLSLIRLEIKTETRRASQYRPERWLLCKINGVYWLLLYCVKWFTPTFAYNAGYRRLFLPMPSSFIHATFQQCPTTERHL
jgi:hypothetical protein